jgi:hypothetical protein
MHCKYFSLINACILIHFFFQDLKRAEIFKLHNKSGFHLTGEALVYSTVTGQEITLTGIRYLMCL